MFLLGREFVEVVAHGIELEAGDFLVKMFGDNVDLGLEVLVIRNQVFGGERLIGEAHVHDGSGMAFGGGKIDEAAFSEEIDFAAVFHLEFVHHGTNFLFAGGQFF